MNWKRIAWTVVLVPLVAASLITLTGCFVRWHDDDRGGDHGGEGHHGDRHEGDRHD